MYSSNPAAARHERPWDTRITHDVTLDPRVHVLVQPNYYTGPVLEVPWDASSEAGAGAGAGAGLTVLAYLKMRLMGCTITFWTFWPPP